MRLIDADALLGKNGAFNQKGCCGNCSICRLHTKEGCSVILEAPTAYDVDGVVGLLEEQRDKYYDIANDDLYLHKERREARLKAEGVSIVIEIVKKRRCKQ